MTHAPMPPAVRDNLIIWRAAFSSIAALARNTATYPGTPQESAVFAARAARLMFDLDWLLKLIERPASEPCDCDLCVARRAIRCLQSIPIFAGDPPPAEVQA